MNIDRHNHNLNRHDSPAYAPSVLLSRPASTYHRPYHLQLTDGQPRSTRSSHSFVAGPPPPLTSIYLQ